MLNLHDPLEEMRSHFREVWLRYSKEGEGAALEYLNSAVRPYLEAYSGCDEEAEEVRLQSILMEEKRRWEDVQHTASLVVSQLRADQCSPLESLSAEFVAAPEASIPAAIRPRQDMGTRPIEPEIVQNAPAGDLDLAGMIDGMLREERSSA